MNTSTLKIAIEVDDKGSVKLRELGNEAKNAGEKGEKSMGGFRGKVNELKGSTDLTIGSIGKLAGMGFAAGIAGLAALTAGMVSTLGAASDLAETQGKFDVVFAGQLGQAEKWSKELVAGYAMSTEESKRYLAAMQDLLVPMGMLPDAAARMSNEVVRLSADLGSFNNLPTGQVMDDIQSALVGNYETMKKYGVVISAATVEQKALTMGLAASKDELTAGQKAQAAYAMMVEGSAAAIGDMARTSDGYANQLKSFHAITQDLTAAMGKQLLPIAADVLGTLNSGMRDNAGSVENLAVILTTKLLQGLDGVLTGVEYLHVGWKMLETAIPVVANAMVQATTLMFEGLRKLLFPLDGIFIAMEKTAAFMGKEFINPLDTIQAKMDEMGNVTQGVMEETFQDIINVQGQYDKLHGTIGGYIKSVNETKTATVAANTSIISSIQATSTAVVSAVNKRSTAEQKAFDKSVKLNAKAAKDVTDSWLESAKLRLKAEKELENEQNKLLKEREDLHGDVSDEIRRLSMGDTQYQVYQFEQQYRAAVELAGDDKALQADLVRYHKLRLDELSGHTALTYRSMQESARQFSTYAGREVGDFAYDVLAKNKTIGDSWDDLWRGMLATVVATIAEMVTEYAVGAVAGAAIDWVFSHDGTVEVLPDEQPTIIQQGQMIVPRDDSNIIRANLAGSGETFDNLVAASYMYSRGGGDTDGQSPGDTGAVGVDAVAGLANLAAKSALRSLLGVDQNIGLDFANFGIGQVADIGATAIDDMAGIDPSTYSSAGHTFGRVGGLLSFGTMGGLIGAMFGGVVGDMVGDMLNDRDFEGLRDAMEDGTISSLEKSRFKAESQRMGLADPGYFGGFFGAIAELGRSAMDTLGITDVLGSMRELAQDLGYSLGLSDYSSDYGSGGYSGGGSSDGDSTGIGQGVGGMSGMDPGKGSESWYTGGVPTTVYGHGAPGDDGMVSFQLGEGIVSRRGMDTLARINDGNFGEDLKPFLLAIAENTSKTRRLLEQILRAGIPVVTA